MSKQLITLGLLLIVTIGYSQKPRKIGGEILDENMKPIPGLVAIQLGTTTGTVTDINGRFELTVDNDQNTYVRLSGLDLEIFLQYSEKDEFKRVTLKDWKKIKKENKRISDEWNKKTKVADKNS